MSNEYHEIETIEAAQKTAAVVSRVTMLQACDVMKATTETVCGLLVKCESIDEVRTLCTQLMEPLDLQ